MAQTKRQNAPYGWRKKRDGTLEKDPQEQEVVSIMLREMQVRDTYAWAAMQVNLDGYRTRRGTKWRGQSVKRALEANPYTEAAARPQATEADRVSAKRFWDSIWHDMRLAKRHGIPIHELDECTLPLDDDEMGGPPPWIVSGK